MAFGRGLIEVPATVEACVALNRNKLSGFLIDFEAAVDLFRMVAEQGTEGLGARRYYGFKTIAARDAALNAYHFSCALNAIKSQLPLSSAHAGSVDRVKVRNARKQFKADFPNIDLVRHAVAHAGELHETPEKMALNQVRAANHPPGFMFVVSELEDSSFSLGISGRLVTIRLDDAAIQKLKFVRDLIEEAFQGTAAAIGQPPGN